MTNRLLGGKPPSVYILNLEKNYGYKLERLKEILVTHQLDHTLLQTDNFEEFIRNRANKLLNLIEDAMGKNISGKGFR